MTFLPSLGVFAAYTFAAAILIITPGPDMTLQVNRALNHGQKAAIITLCGTVLGGMVHVAFAAFGLSALIAASPNLFLAIKIGGALYLLFLAWKALTSGSQLQIGARKSADQSVARFFRSGVAINIANPKVLLFFITFLPQFVSVGDPNATAKILFFGMYFVALSIPLSIGYILAAHYLLRRLQKNPKIMRALDYAFASIFAGFAIKILLTRAITRTA